MQAKTKPLHVLSPVEVQPRVKTLKHELPPPKGAFKKIEPDKLDDLVQELANKGLI